MKRVARKSEQGTSMAEFAVIATFFLMLIFAIIEFGRLIYTHNALTDAARRGARYAVLHHQVAKVGEPDPVTCTKNVVVYGETHLDPVTCAPSGSPLINGLTTSNISVAYEGADADNDPSTPPTPYGMNLGTVTVTITNYNFNLSIPVVSRTVTMPPYRTTLTAESAGEEPTPIPSP